MKSVKICLILVCLLVVGICGITQAAEEGAEPMGKMLAIVDSNHFGRDWGYAIGLKAWVNQWSLPIENHISENTRFINQFESDNEITFIPAAMLRYRNFFIGGSFLPEKDYDFTNQVVGTGEVEGKPTVSITPSGNRKEWDVNVGYFVTPNLALSLGYKRMDRELSSTYSYFNVDGTIDYPLVVENYPLSAHGPIIGLAASLPVSKHLNFSGNFAYGLLSGDASQTAVSGAWDFNFDLDGSYYFAELGLNYVIPLQKIVSAITMTAGYRFQRLDYSFENATSLNGTDVSDFWGANGDQNDSTSGFILGVNASF